MNFTIRHQTSYSFERPVFLEPHVVRLHPRPDGGVIIESFQMQVTPEPMLRSHVLDAPGNIVIELCFDGFCPALHVVTECRVRATRANPFDYLPSPRAATLPVAYSAEELDSLGPCLVASGHPAVVEYAGQVGNHRADPGAPGFAGELNTRLNREHDTVTRIEGDPYPPEQTLDTRAVSCRDLAVLFVDVCRTQGLAARFVSGYQAGDAGQATRDLHAWAEVYIPGGGWRGYDPTLGLAVTDQHVAVAAAACPSGAAPITGTYRGTGVRSQIRTHIELLSSP